MVQTQQAALEHRQKDVEAAKAEADARLRRGDHALGEAADLHRQVGRASRSDEERLSQCTTWRGHSDPNRP